VTEDKEYQAEMVLGRTTSTQDAEGEVTSEADASHVTRGMVEDVLQQFRGQILQTPPMVSAVKHNGRRLYELARRDLEVERRPRDVTIHRLEITSFLPEPSTRSVGLLIVCSSGTYVRTLCADIGQALGVGGYMKSLVRTRVGAFNLADAVDLAALRRHAETGETARLLTPIDAALTHLSAVTVDAASAARVVHGGSVLARVDAPEGTSVRIRSEAGVLLAVGRLSRRGPTTVVAPEKVLVGSEQ
jgi:tRNA pseudouridine55 synthase